MSKITVLLADDHGIMRQGCRAILAQQDDIVVVGEAATGQEALRKAESLRPKVVVMDLNLPGLNGIEATRRLKDRHPHTQVVVLSVHKDEALVYRALEAGASAYVVKDGVAEELLRTIRAVVSGNMYLCPLVLRPIVQVYMKHSTYASPERPLLTTREREVLQLLTEGRRTKEIAQHLKTSVRTIENHRQHIMNKLNVHTLPELIKYAICRGLISCEGKGKTPRQTIYHHL